MVGSRTHMQSKAVQWKLPRTRGRYGKKDKGRKQQCGHKSPKCKGNKSIRILTLPYFRVDRSTSFHPLSKVRWILCKPGLLSGPWAEWVYSSSLMSSWAVRRSPGAKGWFNPVNRYSEGSGRGCYETWISCDKPSVLTNTHSGYFMQLPLDHVAEFIKVWRSRY